MQQDRRLFFESAENYTTKYSEKLTEYQTIELITNEDMLKVLIESNYWKRFCPIEKKNQSHFLVTEISNIPFMLFIDNMNQGRRIAHSYIDYFDHIPS